MREYVKIVPGKFIRDERTERRIIEMNRDQLIYGLILAGAVLLFLSMVWR